MPELPEVEAVRCELDPVMRGARIADVTLYRDGLRRPFPPTFCERLTGQTIQAVDRRGKYLLAPLSSGDTLVMHLGMSGSFRIERGRPASREPEKHDHVDIRLSSGAVVIFNDPRRFGVMDIITSAESIDRLGLGPEPLSEAFDADVLARACAGSRTPIKVLLLDQAVVAGVGNIYASEACHRARLSPKRRASTLATATGRPRPTARALTTAIKEVLRDAIARQTGSPYRDSRFRVYEREGESCPRRGCDGTIRRVVQAGRSTYYCAVCQK